MAMLSASPDVVDIDHELLVHERLDFVETIALPALDFDCVLAVTSDLTATLLCPRGDGSLAVLHTAALDASVKLAAGLPARLLTAVVSPPVQTRQVQGPIDDGAAVAVVHVAFAAFVDLVHVLELKLLVRPSPPDGSQSSVRDRCRASSRWHQISLPQPERTSLYEVPPHPDVPLALRFLSSSALSHLAAYLPDASGCVSLAVLLQRSRQGVSRKDVITLSVNVTKPRHSQPPGGVYQPGVAACLLSQIATTPGPWGLSNVHPSTSLLHAVHSRDFSADAEFRPAGVLVVSALAASFLHEGAPPASTSADAASPCWFTLQFALHLAADPAACAPLGLGLFVVADEAGGMHVLKVHPDGWSSPCLGHAGDGGGGRTPRARPSALAVLPCADVPGLSERCECVVVVGCSSGHSFIVGVPVGELTRLAATPQRPQELCWPVLEDRLVDSFAPVQDCVTVPQASGGEDALVIACGAAHSGVLRLARLAGALTVTHALSRAVADDSELRTFALPATGARAAARCLAATSAAAASTALLAVVDDGVAPIALEGVQTDAYTLCLHAAPGGLLVQVTPTHVRLVHPSAGVVSDWAAPSPLSAASCDSNLLVVGGPSQIVAFRLPRAPADASRDLQPETLQHGGADGALTCLHVCVWPADSAPDEAAREACSALTLVAAGQWDSQSVALFDADTLAPAGDLALPGHTPSSVEALAAPGARLLCVGSLAGAVLVARVDRPHPSEALTFDQLHIVQVGSTRVSLAAVALAAHPHPCVFAVSDACALITPPPPRPAATHPCAFPPPPAAADAEPPPGVPAPPPSPPPEAPPPSPPVALAVRIAVPAGTTLMQAAALPAGPGRQSSSLVAWVARDGDLNVGELNAALGVRTVTRAIDGVPTHLARSAAFGVVACHEVNHDLGTSRLRLFHERQLAPVLDMDLAPGHDVFALSCVTLPTLERSPPLPAATTKQHLHAPVRDAVERFTSRASGQPSHLGVHHPAATAPRRDASPQPAADGDGAEGAAVQSCADFGLLTSREYLCVGSGLMHHGEATTRTMPLFSVFRLAAHHVESRAVMRYSIDLMGVVQLASACHAVASVRPIIREARLRRSKPGDGADEGALRPEAPCAPALPLLVLGTERGLVLYEVRVDPTLAEADGAMHSAIAGMGAPEAPDDAEGAHSGAAHRPDGASGARADSPPTASGAPPPPTRAAGREPDGRGRAQTSLGWSPDPQASGIDRGRVWRQRLTAREHAAADTFGNGCVTAVQVSGHYVVAGELFGGVNVYAAEWAWGQERPTLVPICHETSPLWTQAFCIAPQPTIGAGAREPARLRLLAAAHPYGLRLLEARVGERQRSGSPEATSPREGGLPDSGVIGGAGPRGGALRHALHLRAREAAAAGAAPFPRDACRIASVAGCNVQQTITNIVRMRTGPVVAPVEGGAASAATAPSHFAYVTAGGAVGGVQLVGRDAAGAASALQDALQAAELGGGAAAESLRAPRRGTEHTHAATWPFTLSSAGALQAFPNAAGDAFEDDRTLGGAVDVGYMVRCAALLGHQSGAGGAATLGEFAGVEDSRPVAAALEGLAVYGPLCLQELL